MVSSTPICNYYSKDPYPKDVYIYIQTAFYVGTLAKVLKGQKSLHPQVVKYYTCFSGSLLGKSIQFNVFGPCFVLHGSVDATMVDTPW